MFNQRQHVLSDQRMPGMNGTEFLERLSALHPDTIRIILSGYTDIDTAVNRGVIYKFLTKPWEDGQLLAQIRAAFEYYELRHPAAADVATRPGPEVPERNEQNH